MIRHVHRMALLADSRCVRAAGPGGQCAAAGLPVVLLTGGVLVRVLAVCAPEGPLPEGFHPAGAVPRLRSDSCAAAGREDPVFADDAVARLHRVASGLPRALNNAGTAALMAAAAAGKDLVDDACARKAVAELTRD